MRIGGLEIVAHEGVYPPSEDTFLLMDALKGVEAGTALEVCCGTGAVGLSAARRVQTIVEVDIRPLAAANARLNFSRNGLAGKALFIAGDLFSCVRGRFDLVVMNPPYLPDGEGDPRDPAWSGGPMGRATIDRFIEGLGGVLATGGRAFFLQSSLNGEGESLRRLMEAGLEGKVVLRRSFQFEELVVIEASRRKTQKD